MKITQHEEIRQKQEPEEETNCEIISAKPTDTKIIKYKINILICLNKEKEAPRV